MYLLSAFVLYIEPTLCIEAHFDRTAPSILLTFISAIGTHANIYREIREIKMLRVIHSIFLNFKYDRPDMRVAFSIPTLI